MFNPEKSGRRGEFLPPIILPKMYFLEKGWNSGVFLWPLLFPKNFIEIHQVLQKMWRFFPPILTIFVNSYNSLAFPCSKKRMKSSYNRWCQQIFNFNLLHTGRLTIVQSCIEFGSFLCKIWRGGRVQTDTYPQKNLPPKFPTLLGLTLLK